MPLADADVTDGNNYVTTCEFHALTTVASFHSGICSNRSTKIPRAIARPLSFEASQFRQDGIDISLCYVVVLSPTTATDFQAVHRPA